MRRRDLLRYAIGGAMLSATRRGLAEADMAAPMRPQLRVLAGVSAGAAQIASAQLDTRTDGSHDFVTLGADLGAHAVRIFSADNANARFHVWTMIVPVPRDQWAYLVTDDGSVRMASSIGEVEGVATATFEVEASFARSLAQMQGIAVKERVPLDGGLTATWTNPDGAVTGRPVRIVVRIANQGPTPVRLSVGGRNEGPRDNRFAFTARRAADGRAVAVKDAPDFGGKMAYLPIKPGEHRDLEVDLRAWIDAPGSYLLDCELQAELTPDTDDGAGWPDHGAEIWDFRPRGSLRVVVP